MSRLDLPVGHHRPAIGQADPVKRTYLVMMGTCVVLFLLAGLVVSRWSTTAAVIMAGVALVIPPLAVIVANAGREGRR